MAYYGPDWLKDYALAFWYPQDWLDHKYGPWTKQSQDAFDTLYQFDLFRGQFDKILNARNRQTYFGKNYLTYADIKDPRNVVGSTPTVSRNTLLRVSSNYNRLYKN